LATQFPCPALVTEGTPEQGLGLQDPVVDQTPVALQAAERVPWYPLLQDGTQVEGAAAPAAQVPGPALVIAGRALPQVKEEPKQLTGGYTLTLARFHGSLNA